MTLTVQELCSSVSGREAGDLIRVGEEALIESTQALTSAAGGSGTAVEKSDDMDAVSLTIPIRDVQSETSTFCLVIFSISKSPTPV
jgi:hypothetical protein